VVAALTSKKCPAQRKAFFCFVFFVATKKMKLLSGNPDGFDFIFEFQSPKNKGNRLIICCHKMTTKLKISF